ncbi:MAG: hypothetical protein K2H52_14140 [Lachnospiraceae bacterium]|nr:hypothetical protein [Lachnospiraceae bacterium]
MANDGHVKIGTILDKSGLQNGLSELGNFAKKGFAAISVAVGAASTAVTALGTSAIKSYAEYEQLVGGIETLFGAGGESLAEYAAQAGKSVSEVRDEYEKLMESQELALENASEAYRTAGMSANEYMETITGFAASLKQSTQNELEAARVADQAVIDMADNANKMGTSMESIQNAYQGFAKQNYTMLDNLKLGYGGTKEEMARLLEDAEKISGIKYDISNLRDVYSAIHVIQTELGITGTTAKEASSTIEGSMNAAKAAWSNLVVGIADDTQDFGTLTENFVESVITAADNLLPRIETSINGIGTLVEELLPEIVGRVPDIMGEVLPELVQSGINLVDSLVVGMEENLPQIASIGMEILSSLATGILTISESLFSLGSGILGNIINGFIQNLPLLVSEGNKLIGSITESVTSNLPNVIEAGVQIVTSLVTGFAQMLPELLNAAVEGIISLAMALTDPNNLTNIIESGITLLTSLVTGIMDALPKLIEAAPTILANLVSAIVANLPRLIVAAVEIMRSLAKGMLNAIAELLKTVPKIYTELRDKFKNIDWGSIGKNLIEGIKKGISEKAASLVEGALDAARSAVNAVKDWLGIASPSKLARDLIGKNLIAGVGVGIEDETPDLVKKSVNSAHKTVESMQGAIAEKSGTIAADVGYRLHVDPEGRNTPSETKVILEKGSITGDVSMDGVKVGELVAPTVDIEIEKARKESER